ncbi:hypothetical protein [Pseudonocardia sp. HH130629-09]|uniref:hypothetical protein n=1 Tax=Pseudonocardia sp. HH130629-09 TaxID=1641402 RepID=UPI0006CB0FEA|nr:hypothetical protein [Pseudonocardia sp. HH130629-09]ALE85821.1 hypothetical protein XF36_23990 [Pseudonocardia sp. HH130629-09]
MTAGAGTSRGGLPLPLRDYLHRLDDASRHLSFTRRQDLRSHVWTEVARTAGPAPTEDRLVRALDVLGPPEALVPTPVGGATRAPRDPAVVHLLGCSLLTVGLTGLIGLVRVWRSPTWPARDALTASALVVAGAVVLPLVARVHPVAGALFGGLGVGALLAALVLGAALLIQRRRLRTEVDTRPDAGATDTPPGRG